MKGPEKEIRRERKETDRPRRRETDKQTDRRRETETERYREKQRGLGNKDEQACRKNAENKN